MSTVSKGNNKKIIVILELSLAGVLENPLLFMNSSIRRICEYQDYYALFPLTGEVFEPSDVDYKKGEILKILDEIKTWFDDHAINITNSSTELHLIIETDQTYFDTKDSETIKNMLRHLGSYKI